MAITYDTKASGTRSNDNPKTVSFTCNAAARVLVLALIVDGSTERTGGAPTYNSVAMTQADATRKATSSPEANVELWYLLSPDTGSAHDISIPNSGSVYVTAYAASFKAATDFDMSLDYATYQTNTSTNPTVVISDARDRGLAVAALASGYDYALSCNQTSLYSADEGTYTSAAQYQIGIASEISNTISWGCAISDDWAIVAAVFDEMPDTDGIRVFKSNAYAILGSLAGISVYKSNTYAVLGSVAGISVHKANVYAVLDSNVPVVGSKPFIVCVT